MIPMNSMLCVSLFTWAILIIPKMKPKIMLIFPHFDLFWREIAHLWYGIHCDESEYNGQQKLWGVSFWEFNSLLANLSVVSSLCDP